MTKRVRRADRRQQRRLRYPTRIDRVAHRPERRRQDDVLQHDHRVLRPDRRGDQLRRPADHHRSRMDKVRSKKHPRSDGDGHRAHVPEHPPVRCDVRARQRSRRPERAPGQPLVGLGPAHAEDAPRGAGRDRRGDGPAEDRGSRQAVRVVGAQPALRRPAPTGDRAGPGDPPEASAARRADRRHEQQRDPRDDRLHPQAPSRARA